MNFELIITCYHCLSYNKHHRDDENFEPKPQEFTSFSEAVNHLKENPDAHMDFSIRQVSEEE